MTKNDMTLAGVGSRVVASYLKGLAVLRLVAEQEGGDPEALAWWDDEGDFHLVASLGMNELVRFFLERYRPTPIVTPWNGGSGFFPKDQKAGIEAIERSSGCRFAAYRSVISACRVLLLEMGLYEKPDKEQKLALLKRARGRLPEEVLPWLDATYAVGDEVRYPALLGTGGNDGRLDFANNFMQRVSELLLTSEPQSAEAAERRLRAALFAENRTGTFEDVSIGQLGPALSGGPNMTSGLDGQRRANPWDFVLALEGATLFAGASVRRLDAPTRGGSFPFHVRASSAGYGSAAEAEEGTARSELWLPLWPNPAPLPEVKALFAEGRLDLRGRRARTGLDAARAVASLGVDRGVDRFERIGILRRNGLAYFASWLGTLWAREVEGVDLLRELDDHLGSARRCEAALIRPAVRRIDDAIYEMARGSGLLVNVLAAVGHLQHMLNRSPKARDEVWCQPTLSGDWWGGLASEVGRLGSRPPELEIAAAFSSWGIRDRLQPIEPHGFRWSSEAPRWTEGDPLEAIVTLALERLARSDEPGEVPYRGVPVVSAESLAVLLAGRLDRALFGDLLFGLALLPSRPGLPRAALKARVTLAPSFLLLRAVCSPDFLAASTGGTRHPAPRVVASVISRIRARDLSGAIERATRRAIGSGLVPRAPLHPAGAPLTDPNALAAALVVPLPWALERILLEPIFKPADSQMVFAEGETVHA